MKLCRHLRGFDYPLNMIHRAYATMLYYVVRTGLSGLG